MNVTKFTRLALSVALTGTLFGLSENTYAINTPNGGAYVADSVPGSFLVFPKFDIRGNSSTQLRIVNNDGGDPNVKLNFVCPGVKNVNQFCAALDTTISFTPHQTRIIDVADMHPPCNQGYVVAYAVSERSSTAKSYNWLTGSYHILNGREHEAGNAIQIQSTQSKGSTLGYNGKLRFGTGDYTALGSNLFTDFRAVKYGSEGVADTGSRLTLLTLDVLAGMQNPPAVAFIDFWNAAEVPFSTSVEYICWTEKQLDSIDANFLEDNLGTTYGSMSIQPFANCPLPGGCPPLVPYDPTMLGTISEYGDGDTGGWALSHDDTPKYATYQPR